MQEKSELTSRLVTGTGGNLMPENMLRALTKWYSVLSDAEILYSFLSKL